jgi:hypothetical protein
MAAVQLQFRTVVTPYIVNNWHEKSPLLQANQFAIQYVSRRKDTTNFNTKRKNAKIKKRCKNYTSNI